MRTINYKLWLSLLAMLVVPSLYTTLRVFFLNKAPDTSHINIAAQSVWLGLIYEVLSEALLIPLYYFFGQVLHQVVQLKQRVSSAFVASFLLYSFATVSVWFFAPDLLEAMQQQTVGRDVAIRFIRLEALSFMVGTLNDVALVVLTAMSLYRWITAMVIMRTVLTIVCDGWLVSQLPGALQLGVIGVALTNLIVGTSLFVFAFMLLRRLGLLSLSGWRDSIDWFKPWLRVAGYCGCEAALRNLVYAWVILRLINHSGSAPVYWNANQIIWGWLLLPILALGKVVQQDVANTRGELALRRGKYVMVVVLSMLSWLLLTPAWGWLISQVLGVKDQAPVHDVLAQLLPFYVVFSIGHMLQCYLYGMGRTDLIFRQSLCVNVGYYGVVAVVLNWAEITLSVTGIIWIFGLGVCLGLLITLWQIQRTGYGKKLGFSAQQKTL